MNYFVTGATGFIGRHLVEELLKREGTIYALVREGSRGKLDALAQRLDAGDRIVPVPGDLSKEGLGIEALQGDPSGPTLRGGERIDHFFHLAAVYDMEADEEAMQRANVEGTRHVVEFANSIEIGRFHHTSSIAVAGLYSGVFQEDMFDEGQPLPHAYHSTKYDSEKLVRDEIKAEKLLVFRPGIVVGHSETGITDKIDGPYYFFKLLQRLRYALPQWFPLAGPEGGQTNIVPVDFVASAMDHIAHLDDSELPGETFHLVNPEAMTVGEAMIEFAKAAHAPQMAMRIDPKVPKAIPKTVRAGFKQIPIVKRVRAQVLRDLGVPPAVLETRDFRCTFDARDTQRALKGTGIACPPLSTYAPRVWDYWERNMDPALFRDRSLSHAIEGKRILITGASSGIGRTTALKLGEAGGEVILVARTREKLEEVAEQIDELGGKGHVHTADLTDLDDLDRLTQEVIDTHGGVDILVNNAGRSIRRSVHYQYDRFHDFERTMQLNYFASLKLILAFAPGMRQRKSGHIINISSYSVQMNTPRFGAYAASKAALDQFSRVLGAEAVNDGLHITTIYMSLVRTPMIAPTGIYQHFPALEPEEAAQKVTDAIIDKPKRVATRLGTATQIFYSLWPKASDQIANSLYKLFPEKDPKKKELEKERAKELPAGADRASADEELSNEAVGLAYLMRGVYF